MQPNNTILSLTTSLLAHHAFDHLKDEDISALHHLILRLREPLSPAQENLLLAFWNHASTDMLPPYLLHQCNTVLMRIGRSLLEERALNVEY